MNQIKNNLDAVADDISKAAGKTGRSASDITVIAVSKRQSIENIKNGIKAGILTLGENYIQEAVDKINAINDNRLSWHFIGHLQSNKAKLAVKYFDLIHSVDSFKLARELNKQAEKINKIQNILIQINISKERSKSGIDARETLKLAKDINTLENLCLQGIMGMPPFSNNPEDSREYFSTLEKLKKKIREQSGNNSACPLYMEHLSMGMSQDYKVAVEEGATMVRIGTKLFGQRL